MCFDKLKRFLGRQERWVDCSERELDSLSLFSLAEPAVRGQKGKKERNKGNGASPLPGCFRAAPFPVSGALFLFTFSAKNIWWMVFHHSVKACDMLKWQR